MRFGKKLPSKGKILDIGAGTGAFGYIFKELGYDVVVVDVAPRMIQMCKKNGLNGITSPILWNKESLILIIRLI